MTDYATWRRVRDIAETRADAHNRRAMSDSDYHLTGLITCPHCGNKYIGTSAKGRNRLYRHYTCYSRVRYGAHGCDAPRLDATALDAATLQALYDLYSNADRLIADAITRAQHHHRTANADRRGELDAIETAIAAKSAARDRYRAAFENGAMDEADAGTRLRELRTEIDTLTVRRDEIADAIEDEPAAPSPATLDRIREHLARVMADGSSAERKATIEQLIAEIRITEDDEVIPVFRVPGPDDAVRAMTGLVGRQGFEPRT